MSRMTLRCLGTLALVGVGGGLGSGCVSDRELAAPERHLSVVAPLTPEGEVIGNVYENGQRTTSNDYWVVLDPDNETRQRLYQYKPPGVSYEEWADTTMWVDPNHLSWMYEWFDPKGGGNCGDVEHWESGSLANRFPETHADGGGGAERHCIVPGIYEFQLRQGGISGPIVRAFKIAYVPTRGHELIWNTTDTCYEFVETTDWDDLAEGWNDLYVHVDLTGGAWSDTPYLRIENALDDPYKSGFAHQPSPAGTSNDYFRFGVGNSRSTWNLSPGGRSLANLYWDRVYDPLRTSGHYDFRDWGAEATCAQRLHQYLRLHRFTHAETSRDFVVALELKRPDEPDGAGGVAQHAVSIEVTSPPPGFLGTYEDTLVWNTTDQYLTVGDAERGSHMRYRWLPSGSSGTAWTTDTLYDFPGHSGTGYQTVTLYAWDTMEHDTVTSVLGLSVHSSMVSLSGPIFVTDKRVKTYYSNVNGRWWERYNPNLTFYLATWDYPTEFHRIWPAGDYTVEVRQAQSVDATRLGRGRLHVTRCHYNLGPCREFIMASGSRGPSVNDSVQAASVLADVFGAGPWLTWRAPEGPRAVRFYDLFGAHDAGQTFGTTAWLTSATGTVADDAGTAPLTWRQIEVGTVEAHAVSFTIAARRDGAAYTFGFAVDPDLGTEPADDQSGYDAERGIVYAYDGERAIGFLLRDRNGNALRSVQEFGVGRWAPTTPDAAWEAQRRGGVFLVGEPRDVQLVLSAGETSSTSTWIVVAVTGRTVQDVRDAADAVLRTLEQQ